MAMIFPNWSDTHTVTMKCAGCAWIAREMEQYRSLADEFRALGSAEFVRLAVEGIARLEQDRLRHLRRDHSSDTGSLTALAEAAGMEVPAPCQATSTP